MRPSVTLSIPQPCHESWAAMTPAAAGRHCAACQKNVVDFTLKTDAEILAYLAGAANARICGRFAAGQLDRPLQRAELAAPTRWRTWLAAAVAVWGVRETAGTTAVAQARAEWRGQHSGGPVPATPPADTSAVLAPPQPEAQARLDLKVSQPNLLVRGTVLDYRSGEGLPGVTVLVKNTQIGVSTNQDGIFELTVPNELLVPTGVPIEVSSVGYASQLRILMPQSAATAQTFQLQLDMKGLTEVVVAGGLVVQQPWPWHPRRFYYWSKYWLTQPFRGR